MSKAAVSIQTHSRLHFGMLSFGHAHQRQYGGVGVMVERPGIELLAQRHTCLRAHGPLADRVRRFALRVARHLGIQGDPPVHFRVLATPPQHAGLGVGTQLGLSVAAAISTLLGQPCRDAATLARWAQRGERSAIGLYGFQHGGLLVEAGKLPGEKISPLVCRLALPSAWRVVLLMPNEPQGLSGAAEQRAFRRLPPVPHRVTERLCRELVMHLLPAAASGDFDAFAASLYRYGYLAGSCFSDVQQGVFATPRLERLVRAVRDLGVEGVGQSSWGPTLYAFFPSEAAARDFVAQLRQCDAARDVRWLVTRPASQGARIHHKTSCELHELADTGQWIRPDSCMENNRKGAGA